VAVTGQRDLQRRVMPLSTNLLPPPIAAPIPNATSVVNQVTTATPQIVATPLTSLDKEQKNQIISEAKGHLRRVILCEAPFPSMVEMHTYATRALEASIDAVLQGLDEVI